MYLALIVVVEVSFCNSKYLFTSFRYKWENCTYLLPLWLLLQNTTDITFKNTILKFNYIVINFTHKSVLKQRLLETPKSQPIPSPFSRWIIHTRSLAKWPWYRVPRDPPSLRTVTLTSSLRDWLGDICRRHSRTPQGPLCDVTSSQRGNHAWSGRGSICLRYSTIWNGMETSVFVNEELN